MAKSVECLEALGARREANGSTHRTDLQLELLLGRNGALGLACEVETIEVETICLVGRVAGHRCFGRRIGVGQSLRGLTCFSEVASKHRCKVDEAIRVEPFDGTGDVVMQLPAPTPQYRLVDDVVKQGMAEPIGDARRRGDQFHHTVRLEIGDGVEHGVPVVGAPENVEQEIGATVATDHRGHHRH